MKHPGEKRDAQDFDAVRQTPRPRKPGDPPRVYSWPLEQIRTARDQQLLGKFRIAADMAEAMRTDSAIYTAFTNRLAPQESLERCVEPATGSRGKPTRRSEEIAEAARAGGVICRESELSAIHAELVNHEVAFAQVEERHAADGTSVALVLHHWPIRYVRWDPTRKHFRTRVDGGHEIPIHHADGRWIVFAKRATDPWKHGALIPAALVWARHAFANRDWAKGSTSHGNAKLVGEMPKGVTLTDSEGSLTAQAQAFLEMLEDLASVDSPVAVKPFGSSVDHIVNTSAAWQVWSELISKAEKAAARIYLGTDGTLGSQGGAPGVDISELFGVATTKTQGDLACIQRGLKEGLFDPWCAINYGSSTLAPSLIYRMPDADADRVRASEREKREAFHAEIEKMRSNGFDVTQETVDKLAAQYGIEPPQLPEKATEAPNITLAPTDIASVVRVNEARASAGLGQLIDPLSGQPDPDGFLSVEEFKAKNTAKAALPSSSPTAPAATEQPSPPVPAAGA